MKIQKLNKWHAYVYKSHLEYYCSILIDNIKYIVMFADSGMDFDISLNRVSTTVKMGLATHELFKKNYTSRFIRAKSHGVVISIELKLLNKYLNKLIDKIYTDGNHHKCIYDL